VVDVRYYQVVIDCADPPALAAFWMRFTGFERSHGDDEWVSIAHPSGAPRIGFQKVPEPKTGKNRVHVDFVAQDEEATALEIEAMGATRRWVSENPDDPFVVLADPEGNEFCVVRDTA
jgi:glyoxalase superfamily protein